MTNLEREHSNSETTSSNKPNNSQRLAWLDDVSFFRGILGYGISSALILAAIDSPVTAVREIIGMDTPAEGYLPVWFGPLSAAGFLIGFYSRPLINKIRSKNP